MKDADRPANRKWKVCMLVEGQLTARTSSDALSILGDAIRQGLGSEEERQIDVWLTDAKAEVIYEN